MVPTKPREETRDGWLSTQKRFQPSCVLNIIFFEELVGYKLSVCISPHQQLEVIAQVLVEVEGPERVPRQDRVG